MMKQKNKFNSFDNYDEFDKMLFDYFNKNNTDIPLSTQNVIENAFKKEKKKHINKFSALKKVAIFILAFGIITVTSVYAKDIIHFLTNFFTNTNPGIDTAVENGYVQNVDMDFIECNNVGVKVDYVLMDEHSLDISFVYKYYDETSSFNSLTFSKLTIKDEHDNILCLMSEHSSDLTNTNKIIGTSIKSVAEPVFIDPNTVKESLLITAENFPVTKTLYIDISEMVLKTENNTVNIKGNWNFCINLDNNFVSRTSNEYNYTASPYIDNMYISLTNTSLSIELQLNTLLDTSIVLARGNIVLSDESGSTYKYTQISAGNNIDPSKEYKSIISLSYPITTYDNIEKLFLHINLDSNKSIDIVLSK